MFLQALRRFLGQKPEDNEYGSRLSQELSTYAECLDVNALPEIFHYWSDSYVRPMIEECGASNPDQFFALYLHRSLIDANEKTANFLSVGAGNCDTEVRVSRLLLERGLTDFRFYCLDINSEMLKRGKALAISEGVGKHIEPLLGDFNLWAPDQRYAGIMANQSLHHVAKLESLFDAVSKALAPNANFVVSDMIGRNGHMRWPEALDVVWSFWGELPHDYRYNRALKRHEEIYENWDCSNEGFEGIRAQDILPLLIKIFNFDVFVPFGNVVDVFVDRNFGHNFDASGEWDRRFVDRLHARDEQGLAAGELTPTHMLAVLKNERVSEPFYSRGLRPTDCVHPSLR